MSIENWVANRWLARHQATPRETDDLVEAARRDLADARKDISPAWRFAIKDLGGGRSPASPVSKAHETATG